MIAMPRHFYFENTFEASVTQNKQRRVLTFPKPMGEAADLGIFLRGTFTVKLEPNSRGKLVPNVKFIVENIADPLAEKVDQLKLKKVNNLS